MATPNVVPRADQEGGLGTAAKSWGKLFIENPTAGGTAAATISNLDVDQVALDINANNTTANIIDVSTSTLTTGSALFMDVNNSATTAAIGNIINIDFDKSGIISSGSATMSAINVNMNDAATNGVSGSSTLTGANITLTNSSNQGTITQNGLIISCTGADAANTRGIIVTTEDGGVDFSIRSSADPGDKFTIATSAAGATTISTIDDDNHAADLTFVVDGFVKFDSAGTDSGGVEIENGSASGNAALLIDNDDNDQIALDIDAENRTANIIDIDARTLTTGSAIYIDADSYLAGGGIIHVDFDDVNTDSLNRGTNGLINADYDKAVATASGQTTNVIGVSANMSDSATNVGTQTMTAFFGSVDYTSTGGNVVGVGMELIVTDADINAGILLTVEDGAANPDIKIQSSANTSDYATIAVGAEGATTITTVDADTTAADLTLDVDGDMKIDVAGGDVFFYKDGNLDDYLRLSIGTDGNAAFRTIDTAGDNADLTFTVDGDFVISSLGDVNLAADITGVQSSDDVKVVSMGAGYHMIIAEVDVFDANATDNGVIKQIGTVKIPQYATIHRAHLIVTELSNLANYKINLSIGTNSGVSAGTVPASRQEIIGAGQPNTSNTVDVSLTSEVDLSSGSGNLKKIWKNVKRNDALYVDNELSADNYLYICTEGDNGTTDATSGRVLVYLEYFGMD